MTAFLFLAACAALITGWWYSCKGPWLGPT
jgi:hypothetical protein